MSDRCLSSGKKEGIHIVAGESVSLASTLRINESRTIGSISEIKRVRSGYRCDMIVRERKANHGEHIKEVGIKLPKVLKDMLASFVFNDNGSYEGLATFGL
ncbi:hypothetical protein F4703DRAFT_1788206 [Phycomyces blakesleeanus]